MMNDEFYDFSPLTYLTHLTHPTHLNPSIIPAKVPFFLFSAHFDLKLPFMI